MIIEINNEDVLKNIYNELDDIFDALLTDNIIDSTSYDAFELIYSSIENGNSLAYNQAIIDSLELSLHPNYSNAQLSTFISIWNASSEYWDDYPAPQGLNDNQKLIIADASGSLFGSLWGGVGAIVFGAIASCAEAEAQERGNSNWDWDNPFGL